ncbi:cyclin-dependent kinase 2-interacting protein isoform X2 [Ovis aries]|uniref:Uncharacterized protein n=1 Tax=Ovis aries TaxID=9940 RepID=A0AC11BMY0_SHEEP|nr:cyclin-dependent kinase 2-interacting protein isoform X2 [Ovis aries]
MEAKTLGTVTPRKPVLSVSARKIKDNAADWHNLILKWEALNDGGFATANSIANMKISLLSKDKIELVSSGLASDDCAEKEHPEYSRELETLCEQLQATLEGLTKIQMKMEKLSSTTKGVCELEDYHHGEERKRPPLFHTWPTAHFSNAAVKGARVGCRRGLPQALGHVQQGAPPEAHGGGAAGTHGRPRPRPQLPVHVAAPALPGGRQQAASREHAAGNGAPRTVTSPHTSGLQAPRWTDFQVGAGWYPGIRPPGCTRDQALCLILSPALWGLSRH